MKRSARMTRSGTSADVRSPLRSPSNSVAGRRASAKFASSKADSRRVERDELRQRILATVDSIPRGKVATYGQVAREAGLPRQARLVGRILNELPAASSLPWQRVVNAAGRISLRADGPPSVEQRRRLAREGVEFGPSARVDLGRFGWDPR